MTKYQISDYAWHKGRNELVTIVAVYENGYYSVKNKYLIQDHCVGGYSECLENHLEPYFFLGDKIQHQFLGEGYIKEKVQVKNERPKYKVFFPDIHNEPVLCNASEIYYDRPNKSYAHYSKLREAGNNLNPT